MLVALKTHLGVSIDWLLTGEGQKPEKTYLYQQSQHKIREPAEYGTKLEDDGDDKKIKTWLDYWWSNANEKNRVWFNIQMERTFPEYREWRDNRHENDTETQK